MSKNLFEIKYFKFSVDEFSLFREKKINSNFVKINRTSENISAIIDELIPIIYNLSDIQAGFKVIQPELFQLFPKIIKVRNIELNIERIISKQLINSETIALFVVTIGNKVEKLSHNYFEENEPLKGFLLDILASELVELVADKIESEIFNLVEYNGWRITNRFSPGYCGWNVSDQQKLFSLLPEQICGISLTASSLMIPIKSISGIVGVGKIVDKKEYECDVCEDEFCIRRTKN